MYLIFTFNDYYPCGGYKDFLCTANSINLAKLFLLHRTFSAINEERNNYQIVKDNAIVASGKFKYKWAPDGNSIISRSLIEDVL